MASFLRRDAIEDVLRAMLFVNMRTNPAKREFLCEREGRCIVGTDGDNKAFHTMNVARPDRQRPARLLGKSPSPVGRTLAGRRR